MQGVLYVPDTGSCSSEQDPGKRVRHVKPFLRESLALASKSQAALSCPDLIFVLLNKSLALGINLSCVMDRDVEKVIIIDFIVYKNTKRI